MLLALSFNFGCRSVYIGFDGKPVVELEGLLSGDEDETVVLDNQRVRSGCKSYVTVWIID